MKPPLTMTAEYEASIRKADARARKGDKALNDESLPGQRGALLAEVDALRQLPVIATCGDCAHATTEDGDEWVCRQRDPSGESLGLTTDDPCPVYAPPPEWCPLRGAR